MYHCQLQFYLVGQEPGILDQLQEMPPLEHFSHSFSRSAAPDAGLCAGADAIWADLSTLEDDPAAALDALLSAKRPQAQLIAIARQAQLPLLTRFLPQLQDIWTAPMLPEEVHFRFLRWQQGCKQEKDLWETSHFLESAINSVPNLVWYKDKDGVHEKVNDSFCRTVKKTKEQVQGRRHAYIWDVEQDDPACIESEREVMTKRETCVSEEKVLTGEGERLLTTYKSPLYDLDGSVMGTVGVAIDVTQERAYQQEIIRKSQILETLFTTMDCGIMCHSLDGQHIISVNQAALKLLGYSSQEELLENGFDMVASSVLEEDRQTLRERIMSLNTPGDSVSVEYRVHHADGSLLHIMGNVKLIEEEGELFYQRFLLDCTAQKLREQQERLENQRRQDELIHALSIDYSLVCYFDLDSGEGSLLRTTDSSESPFALFSDSPSLQTAMDRYIDRFVYPEDRDALRDACSHERLREELSQSTNYVVNYRAMDGQQTVYYQIKAVRAGAWDSRRGVVIGFCNVDDETRRELEKKTLLEDALSQANRASKAKSTFLSNMSHDIRTPMNAIVGFTTLALTHVERTDQVEEYLKKILTSGNHLVSLINDVLDMSRIESGKMRLDETLCSLPDILHGLRSIVQADIRAKQLDLYIDTVDVIDEDIYCDKLRLNQVLLNLLSNSIKYTPAGGIVSVRISERPGAPAGYANYEFCIKDTGIGMSPEFVAHIFEPFERERNSTISDIQGTGLGMAITKNIVDMMNGSIMVKSDQGMGTEFIVSLTFRLSSAPKEPVTIPALKNCRALVVDDDFNTCDSVTYMLQQIGLRAEWTLSGREAVLRTQQAISRGDSYHIYVIDWLMPDMNGVEVARRIRKAVGDDVPIIILTAYDWSDIEEEALEAGVTAFCGKPLFLSELKSCLHGVAAARAAEGPFQEEDAEAQPAPQPPKTRSGHILLAEDNELNQEIATAILGEAGFTTEVASNGQLAVDMLQRSQPGYYNLILMDVQMPVMDGYAATQAIRALDNRELASIPILAMTANAFEEDRQTALKSGMNGHIAKPINIDTLFKTLDSILA